MQLYAFADSGMSRKICELKMIKISRHSIKRIDSVVTRIKMFQMLEKMFQSLI